MGVALLGITNTETEEVTMDASPSVRIDANRCKALLGTPCRGHVPASLTRGVNFLPAY